MASVCPLTTGAVPAVASEYVVPEMMTSDPPGESVCEPTAYCDRLFSVIVDPAMVTTPSCVGGPLAVGRRDGFPFTTIAVPEAASEYVEPETVTAGPPGASVEEPTIYCDRLFAVIVDPAIVSTPGCLDVTAATCMGDVCPSTTIAVADEISEYVVPETVTAGPPGESV